LSVKVRDEDYMRLALGLADEAAGNGEVPVGSVVVMGDAVIGRGFNSSVTDHDPSAHAEVVALRQAALAQRSFRLDKATLYVTLEPCLMCCGALLQARVSRLVYGAREPRTGAVVSAHEALMAPGTTHHIAITEGILAPACRERLQSFFGSRRPGAATGE